MKARIKINKVHIKTCVLTWIVLSFIFLFISISPTEASNSTISQENAGSSLIQKFMVEIGINDLEKDVNGLESGTGFQNSAESHEDKGIDLGQKSEAASDTETPESDSTDLQEKTAGDNEAKSPESKDVDPDKEKVADNDADASISTSTNHEHEPVASNDVKSTEEDELSPEQSTVKNNGVKSTQEDQLNSEQNKVKNSDVKSPEEDELSPEKNTVKNNDVKSPEEGVSSEQDAVKKSDTGSSEGTGVDLKQKSEAGASKETKSLINEKVKTEPTAQACRAKDQIIDGVTLDSKSSGATCKKDIDLTCRAQNLLPTCPPEKPQKNDSNPESCINGSDSNSTNNTDSGFNNTTNNTDSGFNNTTNSTDSGYNSRSTGYDLSSGGTSYGSAHIVKSKSIFNTQGSEITEPQIVDPAEALGIKDLQSKIEGNVAQASIISGPSKSTSFFVGFVATLLILFTILRRK